MRLYQNVTVYIHWPFCKKLCNYCNFNKYVTKNEDLVHQVGRALEIEGESLLNRTNAKQIKSIYFGGGTPSLMHTEVIHNILAKLRKTTYINNDAEITLELNPSKEMTLKQLEEFLDAGINRFSIGIQALDDRVLTWMNRDHDLKSGTQVLSDALSLLPRMRSITTDLIFARPKQKAVEWTKELDDFLHRFPQLPHLSLYELTVEKGTPLHKAVQKGLVDLPEEEERAKQYESAIELLSTHGFQRYEISNFSRGESHFGRHNMNYWFGGSFIGLGPGAHGRYHIEGKGRCATVQAPAINDWIRLVELQGHGTRRCQEMSDLTVSEEVLVSALRTRWGIDLQLWTELTGDQVCLGEMVAQSDILQSFVRSGDLIFEESRCLRLSDKGLSLADYITPYLLSELARRY